MKSSKAQPLRNKKTFKQVCLVILDGFGVATSGKGNAISLAKTPNFDRLVSRYPAATIQASGPLVGLPWGEMGNSEVGHLNIGAGRIVGQDLPRITGSIETGEFFKNPALLGAVKAAKERGSAVHLVGMVSPGGVHSLDEHLYALLGLCAEEKQTRVYVHMFTDGRDTDEKVALTTLGQLQERIKRSGVGELATVTGRFYAMDRGGHWNQTQATVRAMVSGEGERFGSGEDCVRAAYAKNVFDEMIPPSVMTKPPREPVGTMKPGDSVIFFNFRSDRMVQLSQAFAAPTAVPEAFRAEVPKDLTIVTMTEYLPGLPVTAAFPPVDLKHCLGEIVSAAKLKQYHTAETEKYAHVTAFFNCGRTEPFPGEERAIVASPENNSKNYLDRPEMSAAQLTAQLVAKLGDGSTNLFVANYANGDMVGHTGSLAAAVQAVECLDSQVGQIAEAVLKAGAALLVTADHGNCEQMINQTTGEVDKDHTTNPVPFLLVGVGLERPVPTGQGYQSLSALTPSGVVCDVAPTVLDLLGLPVPGEMTGVSLLPTLLGTPQG